MPAEGSKYSHIHPTKGQNQPQQEQTTPQCQEIEEMEQELLNGFKSYSYCFMNFLEKNGLKKE